MNNKIIFSGMLICIASCAGKKTVPDGIEYRTDPYVESFWNSNIRYLIQLSATDSSLVDSVEFDRAGNMIRVKSIDGLVRLEYDENRFLKRKLVDGAEGCTNELILYKKLKDQMVIERTTYVITTHCEWSYDDSDIDSLETEITKLILNERGQVVEFLDSEGGCIFQCIYDNDKLRLKNLYLNGKLFRQYVYQYQGEKLANMKFNEDSVVFNEYYFSPAGMITHSDRRVMEVGPYTDRIYKQKFFDP